MTKQPVAGGTPAGSCSPGIIAEGRFLYVSGQAAPMRDGEVAGATVGEQTEVALANLAGVLPAAGAGPANVVSVTSTATSLAAVRCGV
jgi:enamine deaminase RidA (YjgF/YER057c/UK114 family)